MGWVAALSPLHLAGTKDRMGQGGFLMSLPRTICHSGIQQTFVKYVLCARHILGIGDHNGSKRSLSWAEVEGCVLV